MSEQKMVRVEKFKTSLAFLTERAARAVKMANEMDGEKTDLAHLRHSLGKAYDALGAATHEFELALKQGWAPSRSAAVASPLAAGEKVRIRDRFLKSFEGQAGKDDVLTVTRVVGKRIWAKVSTPDGDALLSLARNQVRRADAGAPTDDEGEDPKDHKDTELSAESAEHEALPDEDEESDEEEEDEDGEEADA